ncbi:MAG: NAD(P)/FAD-dependent oxidoreductase [Planctomycetota bacterium]|nr:NAD(P)/FAD-dependent oxidoreductase [Planctomycetota bacterium]
MTRRFTIFGAGLAGALMAVFLARRGHEVDLFERRADPRKGTPERGRSINLALSTRGIEALAKVELAEAVLRTAIPMRGRMVHPAEAEPRLVMLPYSRVATNVINSVSRSGLNEVLLNAAEKLPGVRIFFGQRCVGMDLESGEAEVLDVASGVTRRVETRTVIGADGAFSGVRGSMQKRDRFDYSQTYLEHGYKELTIPACEGGGADRWRIEKHALHIWPRGTYMMIALPNQDGSFTCTLFWPFEGPHSFAALRTSEDVRAFFESRFPDAVPLIPDLLDDWAHNPTASLVTIRCGPWHVGERAVLVGDAAHAVVPFYGQGMNASFEDCAVLDSCLEAGGGDLGGAFAEYFRRRKANTDALAELAQANFVEMRDRVNDSAFQLRRRVDHALEALFPAYRSLYEMVTFSTIPYAEAKSRAERMDALLSGLRPGGELDAALESAARGEGSARERLVRAVTAGMDGPRRAEFAREIGAA